MNSKTRNAVHGFTLLEILITIIISAVLGIVFAQVMANQTARSYRPLEIYNHTLSLKQAMENIAADHRNLKESDSTPLETLRDNVNNTVSDGRYWTDPIIQINMNQCITFSIDPMDASNYIESQTASPCSDGDAVLKITLAAGDQSFTALFSH